MRDAVLPERQVALGIASQILLGAGQNPKVGGQRLRVHAGVDPPEGIECPLEDLTQAELLGHRNFGVEQVAGLHFARQQHGQTGAMATDVLGLDLLEG
jgi:hypothetical protein